MSDLKTRFEEFMHMLPSVEGIDGIELSVANRESKIADYFGPERATIFEQKSISQDQSDRIQAEIESHLYEEYYPQFYGERDLEIVLEKFPNADEIRLRIYSQITKLLEGYLSNACKQIASTAQIFDLPSYSGVLVILNDKVKVLSPEIIAKRVAQRLQEKRTNGTFRFGEISYVLLISETHLYQGHIPISVIVEGPTSLDDDGSASGYLDYVLNAWAAYNGGTLGSLGDKGDLWENLTEKAEPIPNKITRSAARQQWYRQNRYMRDWTDEQVLEACAKHMESIKPFVIKGGTMAPPDRLGEMMLEFGDFIEESNSRGLDLRDIQSYLDNTEVVPKNRTVL